MVMVQSTPRPGAPAWLAPLAAAVLVTAGVAAATPWLHGQLWPALGIGAWAERLGTPALTLALAAMLWGLLARWRARSPAAPAVWRAGSQRMPPSQAAHEVRDVAPYLQVMSHQLDGALKDSEKGMLQVIERLTAIHRVSEAQYGRIQASAENGAELTVVMKEKVMIDAQLGAILEMFVDEQETDTKANFERIRRLQEIKALAPLVDVITTVARQTNYLSINAAIEAARAGDAGCGFAVVAAEIRQLSTRTAAVAVDIGEKIKAATDGVERELATANEAKGRGSTTGTMRTVLADVTRMQERFAASTLQLQTVIDGVKSGHAEIVAGLSDALGEVQSQDVMRQRVEHVQHALRELDTHLKQMASQLVDEPWNPDTMLSLRERLQAQMDTYVMESQRAAHASATGMALPGEPARPAIELF